MVCAQEKLAGWLAFHAHPDVALARQQTILEQLKTWQAKLK